MYRELLKKFLSFSNSYHHCLIKNIGSFTTPFNLNVSINSNIIGLIDPHGTTGHQPIATISVKLSTLLVA